MNVFKLLFLSLATSLLFAQCATDNSPKIQGHIENASNVQIYLDQVSLTGASNVLAKSETDADGNFEIPLDMKIEPGIYRLRVGQKKTVFVFDGSETNVVFNSNLNNMDRYDGTVEGSAASQELFTAMSKLINRELDVKSAEAYAKDMEHPMAAMLFATSAFSNSYDFINLHKALKLELEAAYPQNEYVRDYQDYISKLEGAKMMSQKSGPIEVGMEAPDITLPGPDGKTYSLQDLKGKVVLLDFWASWCRPCRRENPNVVKVYDKYNDQGFEVFSVSLDRPNGKDRWIQAIKADNLKWDYHVSDLKFWNSAPAKLYGVRSIPRTFLIDREGKIVAVNLRGAKAIEEELKKIL